MKRVDGGALSWFRERGGDPWTGFDPSGWDARAWILHAMYETNDLPAGLNHDEAEKIERAADPPPPLMLGDFDLNELFEVSANTGVPLGASWHPGEGWRRLRWHDLARRMGVELALDENYTVFEPLKYGSWPVNIRPPAENALDREQYLELLQVIGQEHPDTASECYAYVAHLSGGSHDDENELVFAGALWEFPALYESDDHGVPSNLWPSDRSWFVATDTDSWATRVSGSEALISALERDETLEVVRCGTAARDPTLRFVVKSADQAGYEEGDVTDLDGRQWRVVSRNSMFGGFVWLECERVDSPE